MRIKAFHFSKFLHAFQGLLERGAVVFNDACAALELINRQSGKGRAGAVGGQHVAGAGNVIAQHCRRPVAEEQRARGDDAGGAGVADDDTVRVE